MASTALDEHLAAERSLAVRRLLAEPLLDAAADRDAFRRVVRHAAWLAEYFEETCGWALVVDPAAGFARLAKRSVSIDATRPLRRVRGEGAPFDRRRYELLCQVCAELVRTPVTTVGLLATAITPEAHLDTSRHAERSALVDALGRLVAWGALRVTSGDVDAFAASAEANAILVADTVRLHRLIVSATAPGSVPADLDVESAIRLLSTEPRYGEPGEAAAPDGSAAGGGRTDEVRTRWARHRLGRRLIDDPVVYADELTPAERDYLASSSGRRWLRDRAGDAGFEMEERAEGVLSVDPDGIASDLRFPVPQGNAFQLALLLSAHFVTDAGGRRGLARLDRAQLRAEVRAVLARFPSWARGRRDGDGPERLLAAAIDLLAAFGLARLGADGSVTALPALARYTVADPVVAGVPTLFGEDA